MIKVKHLNKAFGSIPVLRDLNLTVNGPLVLMGPSGCGKTTLLRILMGLETPDSGTVQGVGNIGTVFQESRLCPQLTAVGNICLVGGVNPAQAQAELQTLGFTQAELALPVARLSGGQQRRTALLRALLCQPVQTLLLDEPFTGMDPELVSHAAAAVVRLAARRDTVLVTASALAAKRGGADRLELCADLIIGGTTPSPALLRQVKAETGLPVRALIRPRFGDFCYDRYELAQMAECAAELVAAGADGIVTGVLTPAGALDTDALRPIYAAARQAAEKAHRTVDCTLHRAFDVCCDPFAALEAAKQLGLTTILTSGQAASAPQGAALLRQLVEAAGQEVEILVGAGVSAANIPALAAQTGARAFHLSGKQVLDSRMTFRREGVPMGLPGFSEFEIWQTSEANIRAARTVLDAL